MENIDKRNTFHLLSESILTVINFEIEQDNISLDYSFDEMYFLHILCYRYKTDILENKILSISEFNKIETRFDFLKNYCNLLLLQRINKIEDYTLFEKSQIIFNYLGCNYLIHVKDEDFQLDLSPNLITEINHMIGYSAIFDFMIDVFCGKDSIYLKKKITSINSTTEESAYLAAHKVLIDTRYFTKTTDLKNVEELTSYILFALDKGNGDLIAELYWILNYLNYAGNDMDKLRDYVYLHFKNGYWDYGIDNHRQFRHSQYSSICSLLEEHKNEFS